jgi:hypothetical protein
MLTDADECRSTMVLEERAKAVDMTELEAKQPKVPLTSPIITYAHVCSRKLTYAHVC